MTHDKTATTIGSPKKLRREPTSFPTIKAITESHARIASILDSITDSLSVIDREWRVVYMNARSQEVIAPLKKGSLIGRSIWEAFPDLRGTLVEQQLNQAFLSREPQSFEYFYEPLQTWSEVRIFPTLDELTIFSRDITERKQAEEALRQQREWFEVTLQSIGDAVITTDVEGRVTFVNAIAESLTRWTRADVLNRPLTDIFRIVNELTADEAEAPVGAVLRTGFATGIPGHTELIAKDGSRTAIEGSAAPIKNSVGATTGVVIVFHDVGEKRRTQRALHASMERHRVTFDHAAVGIAMADLTGRFTEINRRFSEITGYSSDELLGKSFIDITHPDDLDVSRERFARLKSGEVANYSYEKRFVRKNGAVVWTVTSVAAVSDASGKLQHFVGVVDDITDRKTMEVEIRESAQRLQLALSAGQLGDWTWSAADDVVHLRDRAAEIFGLPPDTPITWSAMRELLHESDRERARQAVEDALATRTDYRIEYRVHRGDELIWVAASGRGTYTERGEVIGMTGVVQDITARKHADEAVREETRVLELLNKTGATIASNLELPVLVQAVTDAATELSGAKFGAFFYNKVDESGQSYMLYALSGAPREAFEKFGHPRATPLFGPTFSGQGPIRSDDVTKDPRYGRWAPHHGMPPRHLPVRSYLALPVIGRSGEVIGALLFGHPDVGVFTERTERLLTGIARQAAIAIDNARLYEDVRGAARERELLLESERAARSEAERLNRLKDDFLTTLSHELRTPLHAIVGWAQVLVKGGIGADETARGVEAILRNAKAQTQLIEDLLDMSRIIAGKLRIDVQTLDLSGVVTAAVESVRPSTDAKGIRLRSILDPLAGPVVGDPHRLQQVVWNLLSNAAKFTPKGGAIDVVLQRVNSHLELVVRDSGTGIDKEFLPYIFERFRQGDATTTRAHGGLGIGLSIVKHLVELHGGSIEAASDGAGRGATFTVQLPLAAVKPNPRREHPTSGIAVSFDSEEIWLDDIKVLVVDDDADARELVKRILVQCKARVVLASNASEALQLVGSENPHVIVSDIGMPQVDGYQFMRELRGRPASEGGHTPAIALTAFARSEDRTRTMLAGYQVHIAKPIEPHELTVAIRSLAVSGQRSQRIGV